MLCKSACKRCINVRSSTKWCSLDDTAWRRECTVSCPASVSPGRGCQVIHIWLDPPEWCPYELEHMLNGNDIEQQDEVQV